MLAVLDVILTSLKTILSCFLNRRKLPQRSWRAEFVQRLAKSLLIRSIGKPFSWVRQRQTVLTLYSPALFNVKRNRRHIAGVPCIELAPKSTVTDKTLIYFHGGGYAVGSAAGYQLMGAKLALRCQAKVILVDYRLIPEHPLPAAQEDCYAVVLESLRDHQTGNCYLMGDSAGGALCLSSLKRLQQNAENLAISVKDIHACVLISPWLTPLHPERLSIENERHDIIDQAITDNWVQAFFQSEDLRSELEFSQLDTLGIEKELMPPIYLQVAGAEIFLGQVMAFAEQLKAGGYAYQLDIFDDQFHVFQTFAPLVPEAEYALDKLAEFISLKGAAINKND